MMCSSRLSQRVAVLALAVAFAAMARTAPDAQGGRSTPKFHADDPLLVDDDTAFDASGAKEVELSEAYDFLENTFASRGDRSPIRAVNVNTIDEVPDSSWFTNRIGIRDMSLE